MASVFTMIAEGKIPSYKIAENEYFYAFLDINPVVEGHTLVIPKKEIDYIFDMSDEELAAFNVYAKKIALAIQKASPCKRVGECVMGLEVPHAHIHLIPLNKEGDMDFRKEKLKFSAEKMQEIADRIKAEL